MSPGGRARSPGSRSPPSRPGNPRSVSRLASSSRWRSSSSTSRTAASMPPIVAEPGTGASAPGLEVDRSTGRLTGLPGEPHAIRARPRRPLLPAALDLRPGDRHRALGVAAPGGPRSLVRPGRGRPRAGRGDLHQAGADRERAPRPDPGGLLLPPGPPPRPRPGPTPTRSRSRSSGRPSARASRRSSPASSARRSPPARSPRSTTPSSGTAVGSRSRSGTPRRPR